MSQNQAESKRQRKQRHKTQVATRVSDGLQNVVTGLGGPKDKATHNEWTFANRNADYKQLMNRFREDWIAQKICQIVPQDMTRTWRKISTPEGIKADKEQRVRQLFRDAYKWARVYGTSFIMLDIKRSGKLDTPLNLDNLKKGCIKSLRIIDRSRLYPSGMMVLDPMSPHYGLPEHYTLAGYDGQIHYTRLIRFEATELPLFEFQRNQWYSDSILIPLIPTIDQFYTTASSAAQLAQEATVDVVTVQGLQSLVTSPAGEQAVLKRFRLMKQAKNLFNVLILDNTEQYDTKTIALSGVKDLIWEYLKIVAASAGIPATRFLSASPDGMNATGQSDLVNYIDMLQGLQGAVYDPRLADMDKILCAHYGIDSFEYEWNDIFPESSGERAERAWNLAKSLEKLVGIGSLSREDANTVIQHSRCFGNVNLNNAPPNFVPKDTGNANNQKSNSVSK